MTALRLQVAGVRAELVVVPERLIVAGYTGRDETAVRAHIDELAAIGVPPPPAVPMFYDLDPDLLTTDPVVEVDGGNTSGEVEPVLIRCGDRYFLGVGSDHTDRDLERSDIAASKAACPKPLGPTVVALPAVPGPEDWDSIRAESIVDGSRYQRGALASLRTPTDVLDRLERTLREIDSDFALFGGTLPLLGNEFICGTRWQLGLYVDGTTLSHTYEVKRRTA